MRQATALGQCVAEIRALHVFHDDIGNTVFERADVVYATGVLALELGGGAGFAQESIDGFLLAEDLGAEKLDRDVLAQADMESANDHSHAALAQNLLDAVFVEQHVADRDHWFFVGIDIAILPIANTTHNRENRILIRP